jgi:hypothetical protein
MPWNTPATWTAGTMVRATAMNTQIRDNVGYLLTPNAAMMRTAAGALTTTSTTYASLGTAWALTLNTHGGHVRLGGQMAVSGVGPANSGYIGLDVDGTLHTATVFSLSGNMPVGLSFNKLITGLASGAHTVTLKWRVVVGTMTASTDPGAVPIEFWALEG